LAAPACVAIDSNIGAADSATISIRMIWLPYSPNQPSSNSKPQSPPQVNEECRKIDQVFGLTPVTWIDCAFGG